MSGLNSTKEYLFERGVSSLLKWKKKKEPYKNHKKKNQILKKFFYHDKFKILPEQRKILFDKIIKTQRIMIKGIKLTFLRSFIIINKMRKNILEDNFSIYFQNSFKKEFFLQLSFVLRLFFFIIKTFPYFKLN